MSYDYQTQRAEIFTESGQRLFLAIRDRVKRLIETSGAVRMQEAIQVLQESGIGAADSWNMIACVDRLVELQEIREITLGQDVAGQHRVFVAAYRGSI